MTFSPSNFSAVLLFAIFVSVVFGITMRETPKQMVRYGAICFGCFTGSAIVLSWLMYFLAK
jgi:hypothetical protein